MPSSDRYIHFFFFFFLSFFAILTAWTCTQTIPSNISFKIFDRESVLSPLKLFFFLNRSTVYVVKRQHTASLHNCIKTEISTVFSETSSFKENLINTDCVGEIGAKGARKHLIAQTQQAGRDIVQLKYGDIIAVKLS